MQPHAAAASLLKAEFDIVCRHPDCPTWSVERVRGADSGRAVLSELQVDLTVRVRGADAGRGRLLSLGCDASDCARGRFALRYR